MTAHEFRVSHHICSAERACCSCKHVRFAGSYTICRHPDVDKEEDCYVDSCEVCDAWEEGGHDGFSL